MAAFMGWLNGIRSQEGLGDGQETYLEYVHAALTPCSGIDTPKHIPEMCQQGISGDAPPTVALETVVSSVLHHSSRLVVWEWDWVMGHT